MELPLFRQITINQSNKHDITSLIDSLNFKNYPAVIKIDDEFSSNETYQMINEILDHLKDNDINYHLPFPLYIISNFDIHNDKKPVFKSENDLPRYFRVSRKAPDKREQQIMRRIIILREQLKTIPINQKIDFIKEQSNNSKLVKIGSEKIEFYSTILSKLEGANE